MPRRRRYCPVGIPVHVIQRGNNRQTLFTSDSDVAAYAHWLSEGAARFQVEVHGWVFMTNHVHLLLRPLKEQALSRLMQSLGRRYVAFFNYSYARTGTLFEGRFRYEDPTIKFIYVLYSLKRLRNITAYTLLVEGTKLDIHAHHDNTQVSGRVHQGPNEFI